MGHARTHYGPGLDCRADRKVFPWTETARRYRERARNRPAFEPVALPGDTRRDRVARHVQAALRFVACGLGFAILAYTVIGWGALLHG